MVAKHAGGFCLWQTESSSYSVRQTRWKDGQGDVMTELSRACAERGLRLGVYLSPQDGHFGAGTAGRCATPEAQARYNTAARIQLTELLTRYGPMVEVWFDGSSVVPVGDILEAHAGSAMIFQGPHATIRWVGNEDGFAPDPAWNALPAEDARTGIATAIHGDPRGDAWMPLEVDVSIRRPDWFWHTDNAGKLLRLEQLMDIYYRSVGRGAQLLLNLMPDRSGRIPEGDAARAAEFGTEIRRRFGAPVGRTSGGGRTVTLDLGVNTPVDHVVLAEDLAAGQQMLRYRIEGNDGRDWRPLGEGQSVGHKRIHPVGPGSWRALRVVAAEALERPELRTFAAYRTGSAPPAAWNAPASAWADDAVGEWKNGQLDLSLTRRITAAATYRLRLVGNGGTLVREAVLELRLGGIAQPALLRAEPGRRDRFLLTIPGLGQEVELSGRIRGAATGTVLLRRI
jgi:alpha-L-fucosidase